MKAHQPFVKAAGGGTSWRHLVFPGLGIGGLRLVRYCLQLWNQNSTDLPQSIQQAQLILQRLFHARWTHMLKILSRRTCDLTQVILQLGVHPVEGQDMLWNRLRELTYFSRIRSKKRGVVSRRLRDQNTNWVARF